MVKHTFVLMAMLRRERGGKERCVGTGGSALVPTLGAKDGKRESARARANPKTESLAIIEELLGLRGRRGRQIEDARPRQRVLQLLHLVERGD